ncbi:GAL1 [[Candida] subhashii]|uniref:Galactokinase n=1 Tax=[Candida] subhashii TaxID=561895 RepID=A0A8J5UIS8_9ASCO|nr:GAL1 [[Candida] subhashii]KAG7660421.1 GAL1 [[Candida] subhashii]
MSSVVPVFEDLSFYSNPKGQEGRYNELTSKFNQYFPDAKIDFFSRSPGRVNVIGDHIDYNFFPVLPMAIEVDVVAAVSINESNKIKITNVDNDDFPAQTIEIPGDPKQTVSISQEHSWGNYFKCGLIVAHKFMMENRGLTTSLKGMNLTFSGTVPTGGGLSSSAAFCVASTLAVLYANGVKDITKSDLTKITVVSEHYVGVQTGGMDQCASVYGESSKALLIQFKPELKGIPFEFPVKDLTFVITNSLQVANKHETAPIHYNLRVVEMGIASDLLAKKLGLSGLPQDSNVKSSSLRGVMDGYYTSVLKQDVWDGNNIEIGIQRLITMTEKVEQELTNQVGYSVEECCQELGISEEEFKIKYLSIFPVRFDKLKLYQRAKHVYRESLRVLETLRLLKSNITDPVEFLNQFGKLMNESQLDLDALNNSSNDKLNEICSIALANGAYGSRITGAGWGGSLVHLTTTDKAETLKQAFIDQYYKKEFPEITQAELSEAIIDSKPATGSCVITTK